MKTFKKSAFILILVCVGIQFVPTNRNESEVQYKTDFLEIYTVPTKIKNKLIISCYDCHSNNTKYPWYNKIQPIAWFLEHHIAEGKKELNFNTFGDYSNRKQKSKLTSMIRQIEGDKMPILSYTFIHKEALISKKEKTAIVSLLETLKNGL